MSAHISDLSPGDAIYARRAGNRTYGWYVIGRQCDIPIHATGSETRYIYAHAHREHGAGVDRFMMFVDVRHVSESRYA